MKKDRLVLSPGHREGLSGYEGNPRISILPDHPFNRYVLGDSAYVRS